VFSSLRVPYGRGGGAEALGLRRGSLIAPKGAPQAVPPSEAAGPPIRGRGRLWRFGEIFLCVATQLPEGTSASRASGKAIL
jgi:hypothetical protein